MVRRQHDDDLLAQQIHDLESVGLERSAHERHVERAGLQAGDRLDGVLAVQDQPQVGQLRRDERTQRRQDSHVGGRERPDRQIAGAAVGRLLREPPRMLDASENVLRLRRKTRPASSAPRDGGCGRAAHADLASSCRICWLSDGCEVCSRAAARVKFSSSATATKYRRCRSSTADRLEAARLHAQAGAPV